MRKSFFVSQAFISFLFIGIITLQAQQTQGKKKAVCIAFYNTENLFDTIDDPLTDDKEFLPDGANQWNTSKYMEKLNHLAEVISQIGDDYVKGGPTVLGLSEIENRRVLEDLVKMPELSKQGYAIIHFDSPDNRGVDVALIYKYHVFKVSSARAVPLHIPDMPNFKTRDQLVVSGMIEGEMLHFIVNHWPSRFHGPEYRAAAASLTRHLVDSLQNLYPQAKVIIMGDLNDDPTDPSVLTVLNAKGDKREVQPGDLYNPMWKLFKNGVGSLAYRDNWNLFDQIILTYPLINQENNGFKFYTARVFNKKFLFNKEGQYKGYPFRTFAGGAYQGGYSDHLPVYIILIKE
ncbi:MAG: endonuclease/exonuclease/phosphatase family protein [Bacteroidota bacterium]|nr:endonuclease/exonuclease/phosphatase family protein [Bacteroidota bacterium]